MTTFLESLRSQTGLKYTENGALTNAGSGDAIVDFFGLAGAMRDDTAMAAELFARAFSADPQTAIRTLFYLRDVRGGQGERDVFKAGLKRLAEIDFEALRKVFVHVPFYGRWDDIFFGGVNPLVLALVKGQLMGDQENLKSYEPVSLMAKWLPSENASSPRTKALARQVRMGLEMTPRQYRKTLSGLRRAIHLLEQDMSTNNWHGIDYGKLPGQAHRRHVKAFHRHTPQRYQSYLDKVTKGEAKINVGTVYPYEIYEMIRPTGYGPFCANETANVMWDNLPDYTRGTNALVMADVSGSMQGRPLAVSVSLALYFAQHNTGVFRGHFMTFSANPQLVRVTGSTLADKMRNISQAQWDQNTNMLGAFRAILNAATTAHESPPPVLYVISDMEFDSATSGGHGASYQNVYDPTWRTWRTVLVRQPPTSQDTVFNTAKREFEAAGYEMPHVVFWNVNARQEQAPATVLDGRVSLVSGCSATTFSMAVEGKSPRQLVDSVVNSQRYDRIRL